MISGDVEMKTEDCVEQKIPFLVWRRRWVFTLKGVKRKKSCQELLPCFDRHICMVFNYLKMKDEKERKKEIKREREKKKERKRERDSEEEIYLGRELEWDKETEIDRES